jgi:hypothetical protein
MAEVDMLNVVDVKQGLTVQEHDKQAVFCERSSSWKQNTSFPVSPGDSTVLMPQSIFSSSMATPLD